MKLYYSQNSPFSRIARIAAREAGLMPRLTEHLALNRMPDNPVLDHSPVGRVPTLIDGDLVITETPMVARYIAEASDTPTVLFPSGEDWPARMQEGQILGFIDGIAVWIRENRRDPAQRSDFLLGVEADRSARCLAYLEQQANAGLIPDIPVFRGIALAAGLDAMTFFDLRPDWQADHPALAQWFTRQTSRPSMQATAPR